ncbi:hypothetical protein FXO38_29464 [Capsicum annuum]|nr:hypothetical protein FXO38_29464 [Capsicum annuum]
MGTEGEQLTEQETIIYDSQIRVWGIDALRRVRKFHVFPTGLKGTTVKFCKNIVLAGVGSLTLKEKCDPLKNFFFFDATDVKGIMEDISSVNGWGLICMVCFTGNHVLDAKFVKKDEKSYVDGCDWTLYPSVNIRSCREQGLYYGQSSKVEAIHDRARPTSPIEIWSFVGVAGYYQWIFLRLKELLTLAPILTLSEEGMGFIVFCDAYRVGYGGVLMWKGKANMVTDALSWKASSMGSLAHLSAGVQPLALDVQSLTKQLVRLDIYDI